jgi:hypothetical protein
MDLNFCNMYLCHLKQLTATSEADELIPDAGSRATRVGKSSGVHSGKIQIF